MGRTVRVLDSGQDSEIIWENVLGPNWFNTIGLRDMTDICRALGTNLIVSGIIAVHLLAVCHILE